MIKIIVDSTFDLPEEMINELDIDIIPLRVLIGDKAYYDKTDISVIEVYEAMKSGIMPKTSQPNLVQVRDLFKGYAERSEDFVYISFSSKMSGTYQSAKLILGELKEEYPNVKMEVIDSKGASQGIGLMVLGIHERIKNGEIIHFKSVRGNKKATKEMINEALELIPKRDFKYIGIGHGEDSEIAFMIKETLKKEFPNKKYLIADIGSVLTSHLGIQGSGILLMSEYKGQ